MRNYFGSHNALITLKRVKKMPDSIFSDRVLTEHLWVEMCKNRTFWRFAVCYPSISNYAGMPLDTLHK
jgi:hypothetical protein